jgi:hypothetical protein
MLLHNISYCVICLKTQKGIQNSFENLLWKLEKKRKRNSPSSHPFGPLGLTPPAGLGRLLPSASPAEPNPRGCFLPLRGPTRRPNRGAAQAHSSPRLEPLPTQARISATRLSSTSSRLRVGLLLKENSAPNSDFFGILACSPRRAPLYKPA